MKRLMVFSKLQKATVTDCKLNYEGSLTVDKDLLDQANMFPFEKVLVVNNNNGERFETYLIPGERGKKEIILNGAAARKGYVGDRLIIMNYVWLDEDEAIKHQPKVIIFDEKNNVIL